MKKPEEIKNGVMEAIEEVCWAVELGDAQGLVDAASKARDALFEALDCIRHFDARVPRWISVEERPPEVEVDVAIIIENGGYQYKRVGWMRKSGEWFQAGLGVVEGKVTHWAYLPEAPKEDEK